MELSKGKLTTDRERHSGEGIFFTSRIFNEYRLNSSSTAYIRHNEDDCSIEIGKQLNGTLVEMEINLNSKRKLSEVFKKYTASGDEFGFSRTHIPVELAIYEGETLLSRSQAKRLLSRFNEFKEVFLDFKGVTSIGQTSIFVRWTYC